MHLPPRGLATDSCYLASTKEAEHRTLPDYLTAVGLRINCRAACHPMLAHRPFSDLPFTVGQHVAG